MMQCTLNVVECCERVTPPYLDVLSVDAELMILHCFVATEMLTLA